MLLWLLSCVAKAQDLKADLHQAANHYQQVERFATRISIQVYTNNKQLVSSYQAQLSKLKNRFQYKLDETQMVVTEEGVLMIDTEKKSMVFRKHTASDYKKLLGQLLTSQLDSVMKNYSSVTFVGESGGKKTYQVSHDKGMIAHTTLVLDSQTHAYSSIEYTYRKESGQNYQVHIAFTHIATAELAMLKTPAIHTYLVAKGKTYTLTPAYQHYSLEVVE